MTRTHWITCLILFLVLAVGITWQRAQVDKLDTLIGLRTDLDEAFQSVHDTLDEQITTSQAKLATLESFAFAPSTPTTNPADPYDPIPLRIGTVGAAIYHRPFCPYAKKSLITYGAEKRINFWTREQVADNNRTADTYCSAGVFDCSNVAPEEFAASGNDPWCGANIRNTNYITDFDAIEGKTLCTLQGRIGVFVDQPEDCMDGEIRESDPSCDQTACGACTEDCYSVCVGCIKITMIPLNEITLGMGDVNRDGQVDVNDYLFYHECYSGASVATTPCQNVFDFDADTDVDIADFDLFVQAYDTGNISWANEQHPEAVINPTKPELPLRVGTQGSKYYHRESCPSVNASWERHGIEKRIDYFTWDQVEKSGRVPDQNVCNAGTRNAPNASIIP